MIQGMEKARKSAEQRGQKKAIKQRKGEEKGICLFRSLCDVRYGSKKHKEVKTEDKVVVVVVGGDQKKKIEMKR